MRKPPVQVRTSHAASGSRKAQDLPVFHSLANLYIDAGKVGVKQDDAEAMIHDDGIAGEKQVLCENDATSIR